MSSRAALPSIRSLAVILLLVSPIGCALLVLGTTLLEGFRIGPYFWPAKASSFLYLTGYSLLINALGGLALLARTALRGRWRRD